MLSLESVLGFCHGIAKGGDCKVEFNQPSCWLYSVPNLLVIQHFETLYLGGNHVRVVCERVWRKAQDCAPSNGLATGSRALIAACKSPKDAHEWSMQRSWTVTPVGALQDKKSNLAIQLAHGLDTRLSQVARPSRQSTLFGKNWLFAFHTHTSINTPYTHEMLRAFKENFERETLEKNKIDSSTIFILWFSKFLYSHPLHC